jgi:TRAP-type mannitol/chloroaromatic compound transport system permease small subunit
MEKVLQIIDGVSEWTGKLGSFLIVGLTVIICYDVSLRYIFNSPTAWGYDITYMIYGAYSMLGMAYCEKLKSHVRMDMIYALQSERGKAWIDVICYLLLFFPALIIITYKCGDHALWSLLAGERSSGSVWRPLLGPFKLIITFGLLLLIFQGLASFLRALFIALKGGSHES